MLKKYYSTYDDTTTKLIFQNSTKYTSSFKQHTINGVLAYSFKLFMALIYTHVTQKEFEHNATEFCKGSDIISTALFAWLGNINQKSIYQITAVKVAFRNIS